MAGSHEHEGTPAIDENLHTQVLLSNIMVRDLESGSRRGKANYSASSTVVAFAGATLGRAVTIVRRSVKVGVLPANSSFSGLIASSQEQCLRERKQTGALIGFQYILQKLLAAALLQGGAKVRPESGPG